MEPNEGAFVFDFAGLSLETPQTNQEATPAQPVDEKPTTPEEPQSPLTLSAFQFDAVATNDVLNNSRIATPSGD